MDILNRMTITLRESDVKEIIAEYLTEKGYPTDANNVMLNVGLECRGYGPNEQEVCVFKDCTAKVGGILI